MEGSIRSQGDQEITESYLYVRIQKDQEVGRTHIHERAPCVMALIRSPDLPVNTRLPELPVNKFPELPDLPVK